MFETSAGKLKWEAKDQGLRVELPAPLDWPHVRGVILRSVSSAVFIYVISSVETWHRYGLQRAMEFWWFIPIMILLYVGIGIWKLLARRTILTLTPSEMTLTRGVRETKRNTRVFANGRLHNLRYRVSHNVRTAEHELVKNSIICEVEDRTIAIMREISKEEATDLIEKMMAIYRFSNTLRAGVAVPGEAGD